MSAPAPETKMTTVHLKATYTSPRTPNPQTLSSTPLCLAHPLSQPTAAQSLENKTAFLRALRAATMALQDRINADLTARMEQDAAGAPKTGSGPTTTTTTTTMTTQGEEGRGGGGVAINEVAEEENYGEEAPEEDDEV